MFKFILGLRLEFITNLILHIQNANQRNINLVDVKSNNFIKLFFKLTLIL